MSDKKLDGNELRRLNGYRVRPEYAEVEHLPDEILCKFDQSYNVKGQRGGNYYQPTPEEDAEMQERIYGDGGIGEQIRKARERTTREDLEKQFEAGIVSLDNGMLRGKTALRF
jgi:hypothetical protein